MKRLQDLPPEMRRAINSREDAEAFLRSLHGQGLDYHFDDGALDCLYRNGAVDVPCARFVESQVQACYSAWEASGADLQHDCPIGFILKVHDEAGELPEGFSL